jgi:hypothetical protein
LGLVRKLVALGNPNAAVLNPSLIRLKTQQLSF